MLNPLKLSLCISTNGMSEWVIPVLESIYAQDVDPSTFEVIITDNSENDSFKSNINHFLSKYQNISYLKTEEKEFLNQIKSFSLAKGTYIKFVNHRTLMKNGSIKYLIDYVQNNEEVKPITYFSNGVLPPKSQSEYISFDSFISALSIYSSWSLGLGIWKNDFENIPSNITYNYYFPHSTILFYYQKDRTYKIDNTALLEEMNVGHAKKGKYNLFNVFAVEYLHILLDLAQTKAISIDTFHLIKKDLHDFLLGLYVDFFIRRKKCSYDLSSREEAINVFYNYKIFLLSCFPFIIKKLVKKMRLIHL
jgi:hypothetical protein